MPDLERQRAAEEGARYADNDGLIGTHYYGFDYNHDKLREALAEAFVAGWNRALGIGENIALHPKKEK